MTLTSALSLVTTGTVCMKLAEHKETDKFCDLRNHVAAAICHQNQVSLEEDSDHQHGSFRGRELQSDMTGPSLLLEDRIYSASLHHMLPSNEWLAFWLFLVASSYLLLSKNVYYFCNWRVKSAERANPNARIDQNDDETGSNSMFGCTDERSWSPQTVSSKFDAYSEISDFDGTSYLDSLLSLEEEDSEWLSDSKIFSTYEDPSTPLSIGYKYDTFSEISDFDRTSYLDSLLSLVEEDSDWLSDSNAIGCSNENPSTPISYKYDSFSEISDLDTPLNWDSLLRLDGRDSKWSTSLNGAHFDIAEDNVSVKTSLEGANMDEFSYDEPLFWPFEGKQSWNSEDSLSSFCSSPRKKFVFDSGSTASSSLKTSKRSAKIVPVDCEDDNVVMKGKEVLNDKHLSLTKILFDEDDLNASSNKDLFGREFCALDEELPIETLVGLKEFDGHEGVDSEFNCDSFLLCESLIN
ncbi:hypothetical protein HN51_042758 [Arachis hypogaea]|uniref:Uncharacterized protein n=1 Tax=Arachis hypogaea TaxID=3818 RepID=A0A444Y8G9_ARAHY|nr:uncharacterized protein LOC110265582 [Arachis ipaensis]XP_025674106.1 uncharacterized protein LOC112773248 [Arachis hypogaea]QHN94905.1 uncharacterized protein DS421_18g605070 [Arachis hypogaea]RYQ98228.1 hypothetical protein Ahy_B08g094288 [Arachis hypogaea]